MNKQLRRAGQALAGLAAAERGGVAVAAAIALPVLLLLGGGATDMRMAALKRTQLQDALDAAVLAGAKANDAQAVETAEQVFAANKGSLNVQPVFTQNGDRVSSSVTMNVPTSFLPAIGVGYLPVSAAAVAYEGIDPPFCVLLLEPNQTSLTVASNSALNASSCGVRVNSAHNSQAVLVNSNATIRAQPLCVNGGVRVNSNSQIIPAAQDCDAAANPLSGMPEPVIAGPCTDLTVNSNSSGTLQANRCYRNVIVNANSSLTIQSGVIKITGHFNINSNASAAGQATTLFFSGTNATLLVSSNSAFTLRAPTTGPTAGIAIFQNHSASNSPSQNYTLNSNVIGTIEGVLYVPNSEMIVNSNVTSNASWTMVIAKRLNINSNGAVNVNANYNSGPPVPDAFRSIRLEG